LIELIGAGYDVVVVDNLSNSKEESLKRVEKIVDRKIKFYKADVCDKDAMRKIFAENTFDAVINFAGYKAVGESVSKPLEYYENNIYGMLALLDVMREFNVKNLVFHIHLLISFNTF
jgi:UDP-glucose 4-epimerase